jgi:hypothetical protein
VIFSLPILISLDVVLARKKAGKVAATVTKVILSLPHRSSQGRRRVEKRSLRIFLRAKQLFKAWHREELCAGVPSRRLLDCTRIARAQ